MPFLIPIGVAVGTVIATSAAVVGAIGIVGSALLVAGINVAAAYATKAFAKSATPGQASVGGVQFERQYGGNVERQVACGLVGVAGHDCYVNSYGEANKFLQQVYALSDYPSDGLSRVAINGEWATLGATDPLKGRVVTSGDFANLIWIKFVDGRQTLPDTYLINASNPTGRWTVDHIGAGITYIIVSMNFDQEKNNQFPDFFFEFRGARLYDYRKDSTVGGFGPQRWNDPSTHVYTANPIIIEYNYRRGLSVNGDMFCGMGMVEGDLPIDKWITAANICDEIVDGEPRYQCSILLNCMIQHGQNIESIALSCGSMTIDGIDGSWPLVGTDQPIVMTFTDDDLISKSDVRYRHYRSMGELVNSVSGSSPVPDQLWAMIGYEPQIATAYLPLDRRTRDVPIDFPQVPSQRQAAQLASIYLYENRFEATADLTLRPKFQVLEPGDWVRWNSTLYPANTYMVTASMLLSLESDGPRNIQLSLQARDGAIYDGVTPVPTPLPVPPGPALYLQFVQDFVLTSVTITAEGGQFSPAIRAKWSAITDQTVTGIELVYFPTDNPLPELTIHRVVNLPATVLLFSEGVQYSTKYTVRTRLLTSPDRGAAWSDDYFITTLDAPYAPDPLSISAKTIEFRDRALVEITLVPDNSVNILSTYQVQWRKKFAIEWTPLSDSSDPIFRTYLDVGDYNLRGRALATHPGGPSNWIDADFTVKVPELTPRITGLEVIGGGPGGVFTGPDAYLVWREGSINSPGMTNQFGADEFQRDPVFAGFRVETTDLDTTRLRLVTVLDPAFAYRLDDNRRDSASKMGLPPRRSFIVTVQQIGRYGAGDDRLSVPMSIKVTNPAPRAPSAVGWTPFARVVTLDWTPDDKDGDLAGSKVRGSITPGFDAASGGGDILYRGNANSHVQIAVEPGVTMYVQIANYDQFGDDDATLNWSSEIAVISNGLTADDLDPEIVDILDSAEFTQDKYVWALNSANQILGAVLAKLGSGMVTAAWLVDTFVISNPSIDGGVPFPVFIAEGGVVKINEAKIQTLTVDNLIALVAQIDTLYALHMESPNGNFVINMTDEGMGWTMVGS